MKRIYTRVRIAPNTINSSSTYLGQRNLPYFDRFKFFGVDFCTRKKTAKNVSRHKTLAFNEFLDANDAKMVIRTASVGWESRLQYSLDPSKVHFHKQHFAEILTF